MTCGKFLEFDDSVAKTPCKKLLTAQRSKNIIFPTYRVFCVFTFFYRDKIMASKKADLTWACSYANKSRNFFLIDREFGRATYKWSLPKAIEIDMSSLKVGSTVILQTLVNLFSTTALLVSNFCKDNATGKMFCRYIYYRSVFKTC